MLIGSDGQYDNKNATVYATSMHKNSLVEYPPPNPRKSCNFPTQPNTAQPRDGPNPSPTLISAQHAGDAR